MKNYLKLIVPAMLLLIATSAFAQKINLDREYEKFEKAKANVLASVNNICKGNKYCKDYAVLLAKTLPSMKEVNNQLRNEQDYKQALYDLKYTMAQDEKNGMYVEFLEADQIVRLSTFTEAKNYLTDMPLTKRLHEHVVFAILLASEKSDEAFNVIKQMVEQLYKEDLNNYVLDQKQAYLALMYDAIKEGKIEQCPENVNVKEYWQDGKLCYISNKFSYSGQIIKTSNFKMKEMRKGELERALEKPMADSLMDPYYEEKEKMKEQMEKVNKNKAKTTLPIIQQEYLNKFIEGN